MPPNEISPTATPVEGEPLRWHVLSRSSRHAHLVDLEAFDFNGQCDCPHFTYRLQPELERGAAPAPTLRCWHIKVARQRFLDAAMRMVARQMNGKRKA